MKAETRTNEHDREGSAMDRAVKDAVRLAVAENKARDAVRNRLASKPKAAKKSSAPRRKSA
jgi:hypothetical protein